jgi:hypothetical protein
MDNGPNGTVKYSPCTVKLWAECNTGSGQWFSELLIEISHPRYKSTNYWLQYVSFSKEQLNLIKRQTRRQSIWYIPWVMLLSHLVIHLRFTHVHFVWGMDYNHFHDVVTTINFLIQCLYILRKVSWETDRISNNNSMLDNTEVVGLIMKYMCYTLSVHHLIHCLYRKSFFFITIETIHYASTYLVVRWRLGTDFNINGWLARPDESSWTFS